MTRIQVVNSLKPEDGYGQQWRLILKWCRYLYDDGSALDDAAIRLSQTARNQRR